MKIDLKNRNAIGIPVLAVLAGLWFAMGISPADQKACASGTPPPQHLADGKAAFARFDYKTAFPLLKPLAEQGNAEAQYDLVVIYNAKTANVHQNSARALKWLRKSAEGGYWHAQESLAERYYFGTGLPKDYAQAYFWDLLANKSMAAAHVEIAARLAGNSVKRLTPEQQADIEKRVEEWKPASASVPKP